MSSTYPHIGRRQYTTHHSKLISSLLLSLPSPPPHQLVSVVRTPLVQLPTLVLHVPPHALTEVMEWSTLSRLQGWGGGGVISTAGVGRGRGH